MKYYVQIHTYILAFVWYNESDRTRQGYARQCILKLAGHFFQRLFYAIIVLKTRNDL